MWWEINQMNGQDSTIVAVGKLQRMLFYLYDADKASYIFINILLTFWNDLN